MHPGLVAISNLWQCDAASDRLRAEHARLTAAVQEADRALAAARARLAELAAALAGAKETSRGIARELEGYVAKRDRTRAMLADGSAPDWGTAERQLQQLEKIIDGLETRSLEQMEGEERIVADQVAAGGVLSGSEARLRSAKEALAARDGAIRAELAEVLARKQAAEPAVPMDYRGAYAELRRRKRSAIINVLDDGTCSSCGANLPRQRVNDTRLDRGVHACVGCGGWILP